MRCASRKEINDLVDVLIRIAQNSPLFAIVEPKVVRFQCGDCVVPFTLDDEDDIDGSCLALALTFVRSLIDGLRSGLRALRYATYVLTRDTEVVDYLNSDSDCPPYPFRRRQYGGPLTLEVVIVDEAQAA